MKTKQKQKVESRKQKGTRWPLLLVLLISTFSFQLSAFAATTNWPVQYSTPDYQLLTTNFFQSNFLVGAGVTNFAITYDARGRATFWLTNVAGGGGPGPGTTTTNFDVVSANYAIVSNELRVARITTPFGGAGSVFDHEVTHNYATYFNNEAFFSFDTYFNTLSGDSLLCLGPANAVAAALIGNGLSWSSLTLAVDGAVTNGLNNGKVNNLNGLATNLVVASSDTATTPLVVLNKVGNTNLTWAYADTNGFVMGGVTSNGQSFGIGTRTPGRTFHIIGNGMITERSNAVPQLVIRQSGTVNQDWNLSSATGLGWFQLRDVSTGQDVFQVSTGLVAGGFTGMALMSNGVGLNTSFPIGFLDARPPTGWTRGVMLHAGTNVGGHGLTLSMDGNLGLGLTNPAAILHITNTTATTPSLAIYASNNPAPALSVESNGVVKVQGVNLVDSAFAPVRLPDGQVLTGGDWIINEQFVNDPVTLAVGVAGSAPWRSLSTGTVPAPIQPSLGDGAWTGHLSLLTTQSMSGSTLYIGTSGGGQIMSLTNGAGFIMARIRIGQTNVTGDVSTLRIGLARSDVAVEPATGAFVMINTNVNTNTLVCVTSRSPSKTFTYTSYTWAPMQWFNVAIYLDTTGTNAVFYAGLTAATMTPIATNTTTLPGATLHLVNPWINNFRIASSSGLVTHTNFVDYYKMWARSDAQ